jgi:TatD DNase family protein
VDVLIDSHCHLADEKFADDLDEVVARAQAAGLAAAMCILSADEVDEVARAARVRASWEAVRFAAGIHPHRAGAFAGRAAEAAEVTRQAVAETGAVAIGEIGLDYHYDFAPRDAQREVFAAQLAVAASLGRPVVIHTREASEDTAAVLREAGVGVAGIMHCFTGTMDEARVALDLGLHISIAGIVTFPRAGNVREVARFVPEDRLLVETDAPFLAPVPHRGKRNEPAWVTETLACLARVRDVDPGRLAERTSANFHALVVDAPGGPQAASREVSR